MQSAPEPDDDTLMAAYAHGDAAAFERLYERHRASLYRFVRRPGRTRRTRSQPVAAG